MHEALRKQEAFMEGKEVWDSMSRTEQRELIEALPNEAVGDSRKLYAAAILWRLQDTLPQSEWRSRWVDLN